MSPADELALRFKELFGGVPRIFCAPGRVNLIGEHTDYNDGFVMPAAIGFSTRVAIGPAVSRRIVMQSENVSEITEFNLDDPDPRPRHHWSDYPRSVAVMLEREGCRLRGGNLAIRSNVPLGAGLSSSAALEVASALALLGNSGCTKEPTEIAQLCRRAENEFVGARCGIMDQFTACYGRSHHALLLDCRSLDVRYLKLPADVRLAVCNTMVKHTLASGEYNRRRQECEEGVRMLARFIPGIRALRDVTSEQLSHFGSSLDPIIRRRCCHIVTENKRVLNAADALERADLAEFGRLMACSHQSLRDNYEVSCAELDIMVELASAVKGVYGSRMTGGGFGGCTISLVETSQTEGFAQAIFDGYLKRTGIQCEVYICSASDGAAEEPI